MLDIFYRVGMGFIIKAIFPHVGPEAIEGMPSFGVFLRIPSPYLYEFQRKRGKFKTVKSTSTTGN